MKWIETSFLLSLSLFKSNKNNKTQHELARYKRHCSLPSHNAMLRPLMDGKEKSSSMIGLCAYENIFKN